MKEVRLGAEEEGEEKKEELGMDKYLNVKKYRDVFPFPFEIANLEEMMGRKSMVVQDSVLGKRTSSFVGEMEMREAGERTEKYRKEKEEEEMKWEKDLSEMRSNCSRAIDRFNQRIENAKQETRKRMDMVMNMAKERNQRFGLTAEKEKLPYYGSVDKTETQNTHFVGNGKGNMALDDGGDDEMKDQSIHATGHDNNNHNTNHNENENDNESDNENENDNENDNENGDDDDANAIFVSALGRSVCRRMA